MNSSAGTRRPSAALVISMVALVFALAGSAIALPGKGRVDKNDLAKGAVTKKAIKKNAVTKKAIKAGAVNSAKLADGAVSSGKVADGAVTSAKLANGSVGREKLTDADKTYSIRVNGVAGTAYTASPGVTVEKVGEGFYFVRFPVSVRNHALFAQPFDADNPDARVYIERCGGGPGEIDSCSPAANNNPQTLFVETDTDANGDNESMHFELAATP